jgi:hypothetical protein
MNIKRECSRLRRIVRQGRPGPATSDVEAQISRAVELQAIAERARAEALAGQRGLDGLAWLEATARRALKELIGDPKPPESEQW